MEQIKYRLTKEQYEILAEKKEQFQTLFASGYATGLTAEWKKKSGHIYTLLTGRVYNTSCSDCIFSFMAPLHKAMKQYEEEQAVANVEPVPEQSEEVQSVSMAVVEGKVEEEPKTFVAVTIEDTIDPNRKKVIHNGQPKNHRRENKKN
ncbi:MAG: hypothetical protein ACTHMM_21270 [Agriterribacter sp.]